MTKLTLEFKNLRDLKKFHERLNDFLAYHDDHEWAWAVVWHLKGDLKAAEEFLSDYSVIGLYKDLEGFNDGLFARFAFCEDMGYPEARAKAKYIIDEKLYTSIPYIIHAPESKFWFIPQDLKKDN